MLQQAMRQLRDGEHEDQVVEQLDKGDATVLMAVAHPQMADACREQVHRRAFGHRH